MQAQANLKEIRAKSPEQIAKEDITTIIKTIYTQNPALGKPQPKYETDPEAVAAGLLAIKEASCEESDDEYLPTCCRNGNPHRHPV
jgi:hypothetical protein